MAVRILVTDATPICPYCNTELKVVERVTKSFADQTPVFLCSHCHKILGIGGCPLHGSSG